MRVEIRLVTCEVEKTPTGNFSATVSAKCLRCGREESGRASRHLDTAERATEAAKSDCIDDMRRHCPRLTEQMKLPELNAYEFTRVPEGVTLWCERLGTYYPLHLEGKAVAGAFGGLAMPQVVHLVRGPDAAKRAANELAAEIASWGWPVRVTDGTPGAEAVKEYPATAPKVAGPRRKKTNLELQSPIRVYRKPSDQYAADLVTGKTRR